MSKHDEPEPESGDQPGAVPVGPTPVRVTGLASGGEGVGRLADGRVVFVEGGVPGDRVELVDFSTRKKLVRACIGRLVEPSSDRIQPPCSHFGSCGGCRWQHVRYETQLEAKRTIVRDALERIGGLVLEQDIEILGSPAPYGYRTRARLVESEGRIGYRVRGSHAVLTIEECPILVPRAWEAVAQLRQSVASAIRSPSAEEPRVPARKRRSTTEWIISAGSSDPAIVHEVIQRGGGKAGRQFGHQAGHKVSRKTGRERDVAGGRESVTLEVLGERLRASSESFIQGNALLWDALAEEVCSQCTAPGRESPPERFIELYAGIGFLTLPLARRGLSGVAIESDRSALADLGANLSSSGLTKEVEIIRGRVEERGDLARLFASADVLVTDPPRVGLAAPVRDAIASAGPTRLVYVSCDPATLARDLRVFSNAGYRLESVRALDLFPQTPHVEVVARLERIQS